MLRGCVQVPSTKECHAGRFEHTIDFAETFANIWNEGQRAAADNCVGIIVLERQLLSVSDNEANTLVQPSFTNPLFEEWFHVGVNVQSN